MIVELGQEEREGKSINGCKRMVEMMILMTMMMRTMMMMMLMMVTLMLLELNLGKREKASL